MYFSLILSGWGLFCDEWKMKSKALFSSCNFEENELLWNSLEQGLGGHWWASWIHSVLLESLLILVGHFSFPWAAGMWHPPGQAQQASWPKTCATAPFPGLPRALLGLTICYWPPSWKSWDILCSGLQVFILHQDLQILQPVFLQTVVKTK